MAEADRLQCSRAALEGVAAPGELQRHGDVLQRRHGRDQMEGLEHDADVLAAEARQRVLVHAAQIVAGDAGPRPLVGRSSPAITISMVDLARPRRPDHAHRLARRDREIDAVQNVDRAGRARQCSCTASRRTIGSAA